MKIPFEHLSIPTYLPTYLLGFIEFKYKIRKKLSLLPNLNAQRILKLFISAPEESFFINLAILMFVLKTIKLKKMIFHFFAQCVGSVQQQI